MKSLEEKPCGLGTVGHMSALLTLITCLLLLACARADADDECVDTHGECDMWASQGECDANPGFMTAECPAACSGAPTEELADVHQDCAAWVKDGECYRNPAFMLQQCKASCTKFAADNDTILQDTSDTYVLSQRPYTAPALARQLCALVAAATVHSAHGGVCTVRAAGASTLR